MADHKTIIDVAAGATAFATLFKWLPALAALFTIVWTATRLYEAVWGRPFSESKIAKFIRGGK